MSEKFRPSSSGESQNEDLQKELENTSPFDPRYPEILEALQNSDIEPPVAETISTESQIDAEPQVDVEPDIDAGPQVDAEPNIDTEPQTEGEPTVLNRRVLKANGRSELAELDMSDGSVYKEIKSAYIDIAEQYKSDHADQIEDDFDLSLTMAGFSNDLAFIDVTDGDCYNTASPDMRTEMLKDYSKLRSRLESSNPQERRLINDFLRQLEGPALTFITNEYEQRMVTDKRKEQIQSELDEQRKAIEAKRNQLEDCSRRFDRAYDDMRQLLIHSPSGGYERYLDELEQARSKLKFEMDQYGTCSNELAKLTRTFDHLANQDRDNTKENMTYADDQTNIVNDVKKTLDKTEDFIYYEVNRHINHIGELVEASRHIA